VNRQVAVALGTLLLAACGDPAPVVAPRPVASMSADPSTVVPVDLGTLSGDTTSIAMGLNDRGDVAGNSFNASHQTHVFFWRDGQMQDVGTLGGPTSSFSAINNAGQMAGVSTTASGVQHGFLWQDGTMQDIGTPDSAESVTVAGMNASGQVVGSARYATGQSAFIWSNGVMQVLPPLPGETSSGALALNDAGVVVGASGSHAVRWVNGVIEDLGSVGRFTSATGINAGGIIVGRTSDPAAGTGHALRWVDGVMEDLGAIGPQRNWCFPFSINARGQIAGSCTNIAFDRFDSFVWQAGAMTAFGPPAPYTFVNGLNDRGDVVGATGAERIAVPPRDTMHAFLFDGTMHLLPGLGGSRGEARAVNARGDVAGFALTAARAPHAVLWRRATGPAVPPGADH